MEDERRGGRKGMERCRERGRMRKGRVNGGRSGRKRSKKMDKVEE